MIGMTFAERASKAVECLRVESLNSCFLLLRLIMKLLKNNNRYGQGQDF